MRLSALLLVAISAGAAAQVADGPSELAQRIEAARTQWQLADVSGYQYGFNKFCECHRETPPETLVTVIDGTVTDVRHRMAKTGDTIPADARNFSLYWTIEDLFSLLDRAAHTRASVRAQFDAEVGVPKEIFIDYDPELIGDEVDVRVTRFEIR